MILDQRIARAKGILSQLAAQVSTFAEGVERLNREAELVGQQSDRTRYDLKQAVDFMLLAMESKEASDLDLGGVGTNG
ncbi:hypothetical protein D6833_00410, partial [Candidatus Parcubacteria bacterium]